MYLRTIIDTHGRILSTQTRGSLTLSCSWEQFSKFMSFDLSATGAGAGYDIDLSQIRCIVGMGDK